MKALVGPQKGRVIAKPKDIVLRDVVLRVSKAGVRRVRESNVRSVHAYARGVPTKLCSADVRANPLAFQVRYNPHVHDGFFAAETGEEITALALFAIEGKNRLGHHCLTSACGTRRPRQEHEIARRQHLKTAGPRRMLTYKKHTAQNGLPGWKVLAGTNVLGTIYNPGPSATSSYSWYGVTPDGTRVSGTSKANVSEKLSAHEAKLREKRNAAAALAARAS